MDYFSTTTTIHITNKPLYDFICDYTYNRLLKDGIRISNMATLKAEQLDYELSFKEHWGDDYFECQPENLYDVAICFLIFLGDALDWPLDRFRKFKEAYSSRIPLFEKHFEKVYWKTEEYSLPDALDDTGTWKIKQVLSYDQVKNQTYYSEIRQKHDWDTCKKYCRYYNYDWRELEERILRFNSDKR